MVPLAPRPWVQGHYYRMRSEVIHSLRNKNGGCCQRFVSPPSSAGVFGAFRPNTPKPEKL